MFTRFPKSLIDELISRTNIIDIIQKRIPLTKQGDNFIASCPFHTDRNPSFTVNLKKQFYYCFSCKAHGNVINFLMYHDNLTFIESIQELSVINNISIKNFSNSIHKLNPYNNNICKFMQNLCDFYQSNLKKREYSYVYNYLKNRGLTDDSIIQFNIGFAPNKWNNINKNFNFASYQYNIIDQSGMFIKNKNKKYDRFRNRIMFPIRNSIGQIIAFGGRTIHQTQQKNIPKYLNSSDTFFFKKSQCLYGLYETQKKYKNIPYILLVEGYIDVIILTQFGIKYVVATLGTSITIHHIQLIYKITNKIICCYDGDAAGKIAAWRTLKIALSYLTDGREIYFIFLDKKEDPDTLIRKIGKDKFLKKVTQAQNLSNFLFAKLSENIDLQTLEGRVKLSTLVLPILKKIPGQILKLCLRQELGNKIGILDDNKLNKLIKINPIVTNIINTSSQNFISYNIEHVLTGLLMQNPKLAQLVPTVSELKILKNNKIMIFIHLVQICKLYPNCTTNQLLKYYLKNFKSHLFLYLKSLANWNHMITDDMIKITFIDALIKIYNLILEKRQNTLIALDRVTHLTSKERQELWLLNQTLSLH